jgi:UDPglucose--hexose-1-phosphate uridylyltransferase
MTQPLQPSGPHRRFNPLTGEWVLVSAQRTSRPWQGQVEDATPDDRPRYDPTCYLCPGNDRAGGAVNEHYTGTHVFTNDFAALVPGSDDSAFDDDGVFRSETVSGTCRVVCFSPRHDLTLALMDQSDIRSVIDTWVDQSAELAAEYAWVQVFENRGSAMGASNPHPHGQIWASSSVPTIIRNEDIHQRDHLERTGDVLLTRYASDEAKLGTRVVVENADWIVVVPYWAVFPFETLVVPKRPVKRLTDLDADQADDLAGALKELLTRYDNLFSTPFPYSMGWHGAPPHDENADHWQLHAHLYPPLLRSATIRKFLVGYELMSESQRDLTAEHAAERLRNASAVHYRDAVIRDPA